MSDPYPPDPHVLRDLDFEVEVVATGHHRARFSPGGGEEVEVGAVLTVVDLLAGTLALEAIAPDWMATSGLAFHLAGPPPAGPLDVSARLARAGRTTVAVHVDATGPTGEAVGEGMVTFSRLVRRDSNLSLLSSAEPGSRIAFAATAGRTPVGAGGTLRAAIGCEVLDATAGVTETAVTDYVRNSFGAVNGGVVSTIVETAALAAAGAGSPDRPCQLTDLVVHYLAQGRVGPVRTSASVLRSGWPGGPGNLAVRVEVADEGATEPGRLMVVAHAGVAVR